jgi:hypothetical protein
MTSCTDTSSVLVSCQLPVAAEASFPNPTGSGDLTGDSTTTSSGLSSRDTTLVVVLVVLGAVGIALVVLYSVQFAVKRRRRVARAQVAPIPVVLSAGVKAQGGATGEGKGRLRKADWELYFRKPAHRCLWCVLSVSGWTPHL